MSTNNKRSYTEYTVTQPTTDFAIGFDDFDEGGKDNILVTLNGVLVESLGYAAIRKNENTVSITPAITEGTVRLTRETDIDEPFHKFTAGALFSAKSMDENFQQVRHSQQEVRDGFEYLEFNTSGIVSAAKAATNRANDAAEVAENVDVVQLQVDLEAQKLDTGITATAKFGGVERTQADKNGDIISITDFATPDDAYSYAQANLTKVFVPNGNYTLDVPSHNTKLFYGIGSINNKPIVGNSLYAFSSQFGIKPHPTNSVGAEIQNAINICSGLGIGFVLEDGVYLTDVEIKLPDHMHFRGINYSRTTLKAHPNLPAISNILTNAGNNYEFRSDFNRNIHISDLHVDADWRGRYDVGVPINNQACGIKLSAVRTASIKRVIVRNAGMHCIDVCADQYVLEGGVSANATNQSENVILEQCYAFNPFRDDGITTHNSRNITITHCYATHDNSMSPLDKGQQNGIEVDEGCSNVTVSNCVATGWAAGFQTKGHATTRPADQIVFENCVADKCGNGFMVSVGTNPQSSEDWVPTGIQINNCRDKRSDTTIVPYPRAIYLYGADGVSVNNFVCEGVGRIIMTQNVRNISLENIYFLAVIDSNAAGCIDLYSSTNARVTIRNVVSRVTQQIPIISKTGVSNHFTIDGVWGRGSAGASAVNLGYGVKDSVLNVNREGYDYDVYLSGDGYNYGMSSVNIQGNTDIFIRNNVVNNAPVKAPQAAIARSGYRMWLQTAADGNNPIWKEVTTV